MLVEREEEREGGGREGGVREGWGGVGRGGGGEGEGRGMAYNLLGSSPEASCAPLVSLTQWVCTYALV